MSAESEKSVAPPDKKSALISELMQIAHDCKHENWDGVGAEAIEPGAIDTAIAFIRALPADVPLPELAPEPDGGISLDWIVSKNRLVSLSCSSSSRLAFAWLDGSDTGQGILGFDGAKVPDDLLFYVRKITASSF